MLEVDQINIIKCFQMLEIQAIHIQTQKMSLEKFRVNHWFTNIFDAVFLNLIALSQSFINGKENLVHD